MTKEQESIERLNKDKNHPLACGDITIVNVEDIETVLSMLKQKDKEIENLKQLLARNIANNFTISIKETEKSKEDLEMLDKGWQMELEKKDKQIDLMAEYINHLSDELVQATGKNELKFCDGNKCCKDSNYSCEECIKQYFERKSEE